MEQLLISWEPQRHTYTVAELNAEIRGLLEEQFDDVWVAGEISGAKQAASGHWYFTLKEEGAQLRCVCFRNQARLLRFRPQDGVAVLARGRIDVYEARGEYQLMVETLEPQGHGALQLAFEQLKKRLADEGLFDADRKRALPRLPQRIGIVTSPTGAVIRDILHVLERRHSGLHIRVYPALMQGDGSVDAVVAGLQYFSQEAWADVVIVARGGGSLEDLWTFNEEEVARAIAQSSVPVISAIGHETDFTIADFVADLRAPTPSAAAELVICTKESLQEQVRQAQRRAWQTVHLALSRAKERLHQRGTDRAAAMLHRVIGRHQQRVDDLEYRLRDLLVRRQGQEREKWQNALTRLRRSDVRLRLSNAERALEAAEARMRHRIKFKLVGVQCRLDPLHAKLEELSPLRVLGRGYALVERADGAVVKDTAAVALQEDIRIRLAQGQLQARVTGRE